MCGAKPYALSRDTPSLHATLLATTIAQRTHHSPRPRRELRSESLARLRRRLKGELKSILARCLAKNPGRALAGDVGALAADLEHLARHEPVAAHGAGTAYRLRCFARRQRWPLLAAVVLIAVIATGVIATLSGRRSAALAEAQRAEAIQRFLLFDVPLQHARRRERP